MSAVHQEAVDCICMGDIATGRSMLRKYFDEDVTDLAEIESSTRQSDQKRRSVVDIRLD